MVAALYSVAYLGICMSALFNLCRALIFGNIKGPIHSSDIGTFPPIPTHLAKELGEKWLHRECFYSAPIRRAVPVWSLRSQVLHEGYISITGREPCLHASDADVSFVQGPRDRSGLPGSCRKLPGRPPDTSCAITSVWGPLLCGLYN